MGEGWGGAAAWMVAWVVGGLPVESRWTRAASCLLSHGGDHPQAALNHLVIKRGHFFQDLKCPVGSNSKLGDFSIFCDCRFSQPA